MMPPIKVAILSSRRAPGTEYLLRYDAERGRLYDIAGFIASDPANSDLPRFAAANVPTSVHDIRAFYAERGARLTDLALRPEFDAGLASRLAVLSADLVVLSGYLHILTGPVLDAFPGRVVSIHDADLAIVDSGGMPRYRGLRSTRAAVLAGEPETRSTVHVVTAEVDVGPVLLRSRGYPVDLPVAARCAGATDLVKHYAYRQREWMMRDAWGPMLSEAIALMARRPAERCESAAGERA